MVTVSNHSTTKQKSCLDCNRYSYIKDRTTNPEQVILSSDNIRSYRKKCWILWDPTQMRRQSSKPLARDSDRELSDA